MSMFCVILIVLSTIFSDCNGFIENTSILNIAVIGAGASGLVATKYAIEEGFNVTVYEQNDVLGGVWWYTDEIGKNKYGLDIHTSMYKGLRTNVPIQMMEYPDHAYPESTIPFPPREDIWNYLNSYANRFDLKKHINFTHLVTNLHPIENGKWKVVVKDLPNNETKSIVFDAVIVCNGHNSLPRIPTFNGVENFSGKIWHSHDFRDAHRFRGETVLVIGSGSSGTDLVALLSETAKRVTWSRRSNLLHFPFTNVTYKGEVKRFTKTGAEFIDGTKQTFSVIFFATGYNFTYPFLNKDIGIRVDDNYVYPLYKYIFDVDHPTLLFIGIASGLIPTFPTIDLQVRFALNYLSGAKMLPSQAEMLNDLHSQMEKHWNRYSNNRTSQFSGLEHRDYFNQLSDLANIKSPPDVISLIYLDNDAARKGDPKRFRNYRYTIIDDTRYIKTKYKN